MPVADQEGSGSPAERDALQRERHAVLAVERVPVALEPRRGGPREREPDAPNFTPRISGLLDLRGAEPSFALSLLKANRADPERTDRTTFRPAPPPPGFGLGLTTYQGDGSPLPPFEGEPLWLPLGGSPEAVLERYWNALDRENRVSLALKRIPIGGGAGSRRVRNRHPR